MSMTGPQIFLISRRQPVMALSACLTLAVGALTRLSCATARSALRRTGLSSIFFHPFARRTLRTRLFTMTLPFIARRKRFAVYRPRATTVKGYWRGC